MIGPCRFVFGLLWCLLIYPNLTYAQDVVSIEKYMEDIVINPHVYILKDKSAGIQEIEKVVAAPDSAFRKNNHFQEVHYGFSQPSAWCRFTIKNTTDRSDWIIKVHHSRVDTVQLYVLRQNGKLEEYPMSGHYQPIGARAFFSLNFGHPISLAKDETVVCYLFTLRKFARHAAVISLQTEDYYKNYETRFVILISSLIGICVLASLIGVILFAVLYEHVYISYSIYCVSFLLLIIVDTGFFYAFFSFPSEQKLINNLSITLYYWLIGWHILFTIELLKIEKNRRWLYWIGTGSGILFCVTALVLFPPIPDPARRQLSQWDGCISLHSQGKKQ